MSSFGRIVVRFSSVRLPVVTVVVVALLVACGGEPEPMPTIEPPLPTTTLTPELIMVSPTPSATGKPTETATAIPATVPSPSDCSIGTGLRKETATLLVTVREHPGFVMAASSRLSQIYFPQLEGWVRVVGAPSLETLRQKAEQATQSGMSYEALGYGLETSETTPDAEWQDLIGSTRQARTIAEQYGKKLVMGPGFRLMSQNEDKYADMAALADIWVIQTQRLQVNPPGPVYRQEVARVIEKIKAGNPDISIWAQITLPPDREPDAEEWLAYRQSIVDLVDGTYIGVYTWNAVDQEKILTTIETIFFTACEGNP